jgi:hypothetical protein
MHIGKVRKAIVSAIIDYLLGTAKIVFKFILKRMLRNR